MTSPNISLKFFYFPLSTQMSKRDRVRCRTGTVSESSLRDDAITVPGPVAHSPLHPTMTTALVGLDTPRVRLMKTKNPHPPKQRCQHVPPVPSRRTEASSAGCEPRPSLVPPSQGRLLAQLLLGSLPCLCLPLPNGASPAPCLPQAPASPKGSSSTASLSFPLCSLGSRSLAARGAASSRLYSAGCLSPIPCLPPGRLRPRF